MALVQHFFAFDGIGHISPVKVFGGYQRGRQWERPGVTVALTVLAMRLETDSSIAHGGDYPLRTRGAEDEAQQYWLPTVL